MQTERPVFLKHESREKTGTSDQRRFSSNGEMAIKPQVKANTSTGLSSTQRPGLGSNLIPAQQLRSTNRSFMMEHESPQLSIQGKHKHLEPMGVVQIATSAAAAEHATRSRMQGDVKFSTLDHNRQHSRNRSQINAAAAYATQAQVGAGAHRQAPYGGGTKASKQRKNLSVLDQPAQFRPNF